MLSHAPTSLVDEYLTTLAGKAPGTIVNYSRALQAMTVWIAERPGSAGEFQVDQLTRTALETYLNELERHGYSPSHRQIVKAAVSGFANWLIEDKQLLHRNPTRGLQIAAQPLLAPRVLTDDQRFVLKSLVERDGSPHSAALHAHILRHGEPRSAALFALGYYVGCRVSDVSWLLMANVHLSVRSGWIKVGHKGGKLREIDLAAPARQALDAYLKERSTDSPYVLASQRSPRLTEAGIHHWFRTLKTRAKKGEWELIADLSFHDLRHDFAHRVRAAGWSLEEIAYYLGHITKRGTPAVQTTVRYTQASREQTRTKLASISL